MALRPRTPSRTSRPPNPANRAILVWRSEGSRCAVGSGDFGADMSCDAPIIQPGVPVREYREDRIFSTKRAQWAAEARGCRRERRKLTRKCAGGALQFGLSL